MSFAIVLTASACSQSKTVSVNERYPMPWKEVTGKEMINIGRVMVKNNLTGCGEYYVRPAKEITDDYLVSCSRDGKQWDFFILNVTVNTVVGPFKDSTITNPR